MVKLKAKGAGILSSGGQLIGSVTHNADTFTSSMTPPPTRGWRKKYNSPASGAEPENASVAGGVAEGGGIASGVIPRFGVEVTGGASKKEAGVGVEEQAARRIKVRA